MTLAPAAPPAARTYTRTRLDNGLRCLVVSDETPLVTVALHHGVGWRDEAPDRSGFAHLFEHLMFEGSPNLARGEYRSRLHAMGGAFTAFTRADFTAYWSQVPVPHLADALAIEADRLRGIAIDAEALRTQVSVVEEEIRVNIRNRPYGGFPFFSVPPVLFDSHANTHDGYGDFDGLRRSTLAEVEDFFHRYYTPSNVVVTVVGPVEPQDAADLVAGAFGDIAARPAPPPPDLAEPTATGERRRHRRTRDALATVPALAVGFRVPDPAGLDDYLGAYLVDRLLTAGETSRLHELLVRRQPLAHSVVGWFGNIDQPFTTRHPSLDSIVVEHSGAAAEIVNGLDECIAELAATGPGAQELAALVRAERTRYWSGYDNQVLRAIQLGALERVHGRAELFDEIPDRLAQLDGERIAAVAARHYRDGISAVIEVEAGAA